jgi:hypothetical protein
VRWECHLRAGPLSLEAKFCFLTSSFQLWMVATASASESHDDMYWSVALPSKNEMAWMSSRRFSAVIRSCRASAMIGELDRFGFGCRKNVDS